VRAVGFWPGPWRPPPHARAPTPLSLIFFYRATTSLSLSSISPCPRWDSGERLPPIVELRGELPLPSPLPPSSLPRAPFSAPSRPRAPARRPWPRAPHARSLGHTLPACPRPRALGRPPGGGLPPAQRPAPDAAACPGALRPRPGGPPLAQPTPGAPLTRRGVPPRDPVCTHP
jgi:hypothetical protein